MNTSRLPLPRLYLVTPEPGNRLTDFVQHLEHSLIAGIRLVQFRAKTLEPAAYEKLAIEVLACCRQYDALLLLNADPQLVDAIDADGVQGCCWLVHGRGRLSLHGETRPGIPSLVG